MADLQLPTVTLCAAASVNVAATLRALELSLEQADFAECLLFCADNVPTMDSRVRRIVVPEIKSGADYSDFVLNRLVDFIDTSHALIVQWDGFVLNSEGWDSKFLEFDYVGAPWPQFGDGRDVGNGGFSLRSRRLMEACRDPDFVSGHPEDLFICRVNGELLEGKGLCFADRDLAERFSFERIAPSGPTFGFHGIFNMIPVLGPDGFWDLYRTLDDRRTAAVDYRLIFRQLGGGSNSGWRRVRLTLDFLRSFTGL